jgi:hypothetical protein
VTVALKVRIVPSWTEVAGPAEEVIVRVVVVATLAAAACMAKLNAASARSRAARLTKQTNRLAAYLEPKNMALGDYREKHTRAVSKKTKIIGNKRCYLKCPHKRSNDP